MHPPTWSHLSLPYSSRSKFMVSQVEAKVDDWIAQIVAYIHDLSSDESRILSKGIPSKNFHIQFGKFISAIR